MTYFKLLMKNLRLKSALWIFALCGLSISIPPVFNGLYSTAAEQEGMKLGRCREESIHQLLCSVIRC